MKKTAAFALLVIFAALSCLAQQKEKRLPGPFLIWGPVHTIRDELATTTNVNGELVEGPRILTQTVIFNEDGTKQERLSYLPDGLVVARTVDLYDPDGRVLETTRLNGKGNVQTREVSNYDNQKRLIERITYRADGSVLGKQTIAYNENQRITTSTSYDQNGAIRSQSTITKSGRTSTAESFTFREDRVVKRESIMTPMPNGGLMIEERSDGSPSRRDEYSSSGKGNQEIIRYNPDGTILKKERFTREFDSRGNFIKAVRSVAKGDSSDFEPVAVSYRTIEYYE